jgi:hypothetical protein
VVILITVIMKTAIDGALAMDPDGIADGYSQG